MKKMMFIFVTVLVCVVTGHSYLDAVSETTSGVIQMPRAMYGVSVFPDSYDVLGPFPLGTREIGADPIEAFGGIRKIPRADNSVYPSELYFQARVGWTKVKPDANGLVSIQYNNATLVNWPLITQWAGSVGQSLQGWAIGDITIETTGTYLAYCGSLKLFYIDDTIFSADNYGYNMISTPVTLTAGRHTLYIPFSSSGGASFGCSLNPVQPGSSLLFRTNGDELMLVPDIVTYNGSASFASPYVSLVFTNQDTSNYLESVTVTIQPNPYVQIQSQSKPRIAPGQTLPVDFLVSTTSTFTQCLSEIITLNVSVTYIGATAPLDIKINFNCKTWPIGSGGYVITFPDVDNSIQYAMVRPPKFPCTNFVRGCSVIVTMHGAGVISSPGWANFYQIQDYAWVLLPTNRRFYGFDWQGPGMKNVFSGLNYLASVQPGVPSSIRSSFLVDPYRIIYAGHSMGGHGCWLLSSHYPDRALAIAPASGWINFPLYVQYYTRLGISLANPFLLHILNSAITEDTPDIYTPHFKGIPLITRFGSLDDNVPPFHMRRMIRLTNQINRNATYTEVSELPNEGHWWSDVVDGVPMQNFFDRHATKLSVPLLPINFTVVCANPATTEGKGGITILQLEIPYRVGYIRVQQSTDKTIWILSLENIRRFGFRTDTTMPSPRSIVIGTSRFNVEKYPGSHFFLDPQQGWTLVTSNLWLNTERSPQTYGPFWQIIQAPLIIVYGTGGSAQQTTTRFNYAVWLANTLFYKGRYAPLVCSDTAVPEGYEAYNLVLLGGPTTNKLTGKLSSSFPVTFNGRAFSIGGQTFSTPATGIAFLANGLRLNRLLAVLAGTDEEGFKKATMLFPTSSGVTMPDYAVAGPDWGWAGSAGLVAAGFWDNSWKYSPLSGYISTAEHF